MAKAPQGESGLACGEMHRLGEKGAVTPIHKRRGNHSECESCMDLISLSLSILSKIVIKEEKQSPVRLLAPVFHHR